MFLKGFKEKSNQKYIKKLLSKREVSISDGHINSVGVLLNSIEYVDYEAIDTFLKDLGIHITKRKVFTFLTTDENQYSTWDNTFTPKDFGWYGKLKDPALLNFTKTKFDVLICYFLGNDLELKQITAMSEAKLKVGISKADQRFFDLIIEVSIDSFSTFKAELKKYLTILNKL